MSKAKKNKDKSIEVVEEFSEEDVQQLAKDNAMLTEALQRERADATNIRRHHEQQIAGLKNTVKVSIVEDLLPVIDNFERALKHVPEGLKDNDYIKGIQSIVKQFEKTLGDIGVERIKTVGEPFDPHLHEAIGIEDGEGEVETVCEELQSGYQIHGTVIRHAMVKVKNT